MVDGDERVAVRFFFRTAKTDPPTRIDFMSNKEKGLDPRPGELRNLPLWSGISVMDTLERGIAVARRFRNQGSFVVELTIHPGSMVLCQRTGNTPGHHTLWGNPDDIMACVTRVIDIDALEEGRK